MRGHRRFRSSEIHRLKALLVGFPTRYRLRAAAAMPRNVKQNLETAVTASSRDLGKAEYRDRQYQDLARPKRTIVRWKAYEQGFQTVYL